ncbi:GFA family protein [Tahibacter amnicola]|uniref:GFA family protein n=1 Tax=Tahibacter amnicola TaxID=2976241 RepID=A0ABY6BGD0_9GAMM|nr:GFA family protein [Tahibacter amnicola]UXI69079.1 GFA family protein [Tahibacter amnicola]
MHPDHVLHHGGCHCGRVRFEVEAPAQIDAIRCNCSICRMTGFLHLIVPATRFRLVAGAEHLSEYTFNTGTAKHRFCGVCGVKPFYIPRSNPDGFDVNVNCLDAGTVASVRETPFDDTQREESEAAIRHLSLG